MRALVTGHRGYIGSKVYDRLIKDGLDVEGIDLKEGSDILECLHQRRYDFIFHLAALPRVEYSVNNPYYTLKQNVLATSKLLEFAVKNACQRVIFSSSSAIYGNGSGPTSPYGLHKLMSEMECKLYSELYGLDTVCLRYFNAYSEDQEFGGAYSTVISAWLEMIRQRRPLRIDGDGEQTRDFVHVKDIVDANIFCMKTQNKLNGSCFDVGTGQSISINQIKEIVENNIKNVEWHCAQARPGDARHTLADTEPLKKLGWESKIDIYDGIISCFKNTQQRK